MGEGHPPRGGVLVAGIRRNIYDTFSQHKNTSCYPVLPDVISRYLSGIMKMMNTLSKTDLFALEFLNIYSDEVRDHFVALGDYNAMIRLAYLFAEQMVAKGKE